MKKEVLSFIKRRFSKDCDWLTGNCYYFAQILCLRFHILEVCYLPVEGHFVAYDETTQKYYDYLGEHNLKDTKILKLADIRHDDPAWYIRLMNDCTY